jgi:chemotaxis protein MotB
MAKNDDDKRPIIIIKKVKKMEGGHHGGAWKVAYADFVTAMMAFFLLLWLLNVTTEQQKMMISSYFAPADPRVSQNLSGSGGVMGGTTISPDGAMTSTQAPAISETDPVEMTEAEALEKAELEKQDEKSFKETEEKIRQAIDSAPELKALAQNLIIDMTPEGLRIQIIDQEGKPMFAVGSVIPMPSAEKLLTVVATVIKPLRNKISVRGHTDSTPYGKDAAYGNWELSADRANASRRVVLTAGLEASRIENVQGKADREPLVPADPTSARNRRISIILLKQALTAAKKSSVKSSTKPAPVVRPEGKKKEEGIIYFP